MYFNKLERAINDAKNGDDKLLNQCVQNGIIDVKPKDIMMQTSSNVLRPLIEKSGYQLVKEAFLKQMNQYLNDLNVSNVEEGDVVFEKHWNKYLKENDLNIHFYAFEAYLQPIILEMNVDNEKENVIIFPTLKTDMNNIASAFDEYTKTNNLEPLEKAIKNFDSEVEQLSKQLNDSHDFFIKTINQINIDKKYFELSNDNEKLLSDFIEVMKNDSDYQELMDGVNEIKKLEEKYNFEVEDDSFEFDEASVYPYVGDVFEILKNKLSNTNINTNEEKIKKEATDLAQFIFESNLEYINEFLYPTEENDGVVTSSYGCGNVFYLSPEMRLSNLDNPISIDMGYFIDSDDDDLETIKDLIEDFSLEEAEDYGYVEIDVSDEGYYYQGGARIFKEYKEQIEAIINFSDEFNTMEKEINKQVEEEIDERFDDIVEEMVEQ